MIVIGQEETFGGDVQVYGIHVLSIFHTYILLSKLTNLCILHVYINLNALHTFVEHFVCPSYFKVFFVCFLTGVWSQLKIFQPNQHFQLLPPTNLQESDTQRLILIKTGDKDSLPFKVPPLQGSLYPVPEMMLLQVDAQVLMRASPLSLQLPTHKYGLLGSTSPTLCDQTGVGPLTQDGRVTDHP